MKNIPAFFFLTAAFALCADAGEQKQPTGETVPGAKPASASALDPDFARFVAAKRSQAKLLSADQELKFPEEAWAYFDAVERDDHQAASNANRFLHQNAGVYEGSRSNPALHTKAYAPIQEVIGAYGLFKSWDNKLLHEYGNDLIDSVPAGSIYFGGTDPGRFLVSALCASQIDGKPFFTITQNALADATYLQYLRAMYGEKIHIPSTEDLQKCYDDYMKDIQRRLEHDQRFPGEPRQVMPGENVTRTAGGAMSISGNAAVMNVNALLVTVILDRNPGREFYLEESFPLAWTFPHLTPNGLIMKLNRQPVARLTDETIKQDHEYWRRQTGRLIGDWLTYDTPMKEICDFADKAFFQKDLAGFKGDPNYVTNLEAQRTFSKLRSSLGGLYAWRVGQLQGVPTPGEYQEKTPAGRGQMIREADFAFRQAFALCPTSAEVVYRYAPVLANNGRIDDALLIAATSLKLDPADTNLDNLVQALKKIKYHPESIQPK
jgi:tetratricopeptide (TPR) repeat protein